ncbi:amidohydrolase family protein [Streptomyces sp. Lzd4kr]|nr:amidohydrolase family protein [Streptomyces sp. Lzd4kr]
MSVTGELFDVHAHFTTESYIAAARRAGYAGPDQMPGWVEWSARTHLDVMDRHNIGRAMLSLSSPGVHFGEDRSARLLAREVNDFAAQTRIDHPDRFEFLATLPLPDVPAAVSEAVHALDRLAALGVALLTHSAGMYLGNPGLAPLWDVLDQHAALVLIHPTTPLLRPATTHAMPPPVLDFLFETTRSVVDLVLGGVTTRWPRVRFIVPHGGAALPLAAERIGFFQRRLNPGDEQAGARIHDALRGLWYDTAGTPYPTQLPALTTAFGTEHIVYGSDYCWTPPDDVARQIQALDSTPPPHGAVSWRELTSANARRLLAAPEQCTSDDV